jgi:hypothetical protein
VISALSAASIVRYDASTAITRDPASAMLAFTTISEILLPGSRAAAMSWYQGGLDERARGSTESVPQSLVLIAEQANQCA